MVTLDRHHRSGELQSSLKFQFFVRKKRKITQSQCLCNSSALGVHMSRYSQACQLYLTIKQSRYMHSRPDVGLVGRLRFSNFCTIQYWLRHHAERLKLVPTELKRQAAFAHLCFSWSGSIPLGHTKRLTCHHIIVKKSHCQDVWWPQILAMELWLLALHKLSAVHEVSKQMYFRDFYIHAGTWA